ncbi:MAG TPA: nuclear transport factor 2 family protein [Alphaproteobacteria bacterium]|nr:nuclear transport factor 2 family protein [Alphaproteobacteria bacterium]
MSALSHADRRRIFGEAVTAFGRKEFDRFERYFIADAVFEWPYLPVESWPHTMVGTRAFRESSEKGMADFDPYNHKVTRFYDQVEADLLIAEYVSDTIYRPNGKRYSNQYLGIVRFAGGKIGYWKEYINPVVVKDVMGL